MKKVEESEKKQEKVAPSSGNDVASILQRRIALEISDSENSSDDWSDDDQEWDD